MVTLWQDDSHLSILWVHLEVDLSTLAWICGGSEAFKKLPPFSCPLKVFSAVHKASSFSLPLAALRSSPFLFDNSHLEAVLIYISLIITNVEHFSWVFIILCCLWRNCLFAPFAWIFSRHCRFSKCQIFQISNYVLIYSLITVTSMSMSMMMVWNTVECSLRTGCSAKCFMHILVNYFSKRLCRCDRSIKS